MLQLKNDVKSLRELFDKKPHVVLYGAGASTKLFLQSYYDMLPEKSLEFIVDGDVRLDGRYCIAGGNIRVKIISLKHLCEIWGGEGTAVYFSDDAILFSAFYPSFRSNG